MKSPVYLKKSDRLTMHSFTKPKPYRRTLVLFEIPMGQRPDTCLPFCCYLFPYSSLNGLQKVTG